MVDIENVSQKACSQPSCALSLSILSKLQWTRNGLAGFNADKGGGRCGLCWCVGGQEPPAPKSPCLPCVAFPDFPSSRSRWT